MTDGILEILARGGGGGGVGSKTSEIPLEVGLNMKKKLL